MSGQEDKPPVMSEAVARAKPSERKQVLAMPMPVQAAPPPSDPAAQLALQAAHAVQAAKAAQAVQAAHMQVQAAQAVQVQYPVHAR